MSKLFSDCSLYAFNNQIKTMIAGDVVNNLKLFVASDEAKLSVTLEKKITENDEYHGLSPKFDNEELKNFLEDFYLCGEFWKQVQAIQEKDSLFSINQFSDLMKETETEMKKICSDKNELEILLFGRAILQMASHFGYKLKLEKNQVEKFKEDLIKITKEACDISFTVTKKTENDISETIFWQIKEGKEDYGEVIFKGIWPLEMISKISQLYDIKEADGELIIFAKDSYGGGNSLESLLLLKKPKSFTLVSGDVYYSGVMPRVLSIRYNENPVESGNVKYLVLEVGRTSYATIDFMDNPIILNHPFFAEGSKKETMIRFDEYEDLIQASYLNTEEVSRKLNQREYEKAEIDKLNQYLKHSFNTHTVAVSANIETKDGYLILGKRNIHSIDSGEYYCSVNGQSEFCDENVSFYRNSVFEDLPSMDYDSKYRIDLRKELKRETIAELGITAIESEWQYHGISYLNINNGNKSWQSIKKRRMHFNVLSSNKTGLNFEDILKTQNLATEKFENSEIRGLKTNLYINKQNRLKKYLLRILSWLDRNKSHFILIFLLVKFLLTKDINILSVETIVDGIVLIAYISTLVLKYWRDSEVRKLKSEINILYPKYIDGNSLRLDILFEVISKKFTNEKGKFHAIFRIMYGLYFLDKFAECNMEKD